LHIFVTLLIRIRIIDKNSVMGKFDKMVANIMKTKKVTGFYITMPGDLSIGVNDIEWKLEGDFYFDKEHEVEEFKALLLLTYRSYCGEDCLVETFEERQNQIDIELEKQ
jgi:hypothetical protein